MKKVNSDHKWTNIFCQCSQADEEMCSFLFFQNEAVGLEVENLKDEAICIKASFSADTLLLKNIDDLRQQFERAGLSKIAKTLKAEAIADQDWLSNWKKHFVPFAVGDSFLICPPWQVKSVTAKELGNRKKIIIDPGMAFGTGQHITTSFCLHALEKWMKGPNLLDVGTGSGILSIASILLSPSSHVVALDIDENSIANAMQNIELNHVQDKIDLQQKSPDTLESSQFNTVMSNLTAETIIELLPAYNNLLVPGGVLILAGIIEERLSLLEKALSQYAWQKLEQTIERGWVGLVLSKGST